MTFQSCFPSAHLSFSKIEALKSFSKSDLVTWFKAHRGPGSKMLSVHVSMMNYTAIPSFQVMTE